jgi:PKD repeat protein
LNTWTYTVDAYSVYHFTFTGDGATSYSWDFGDSTSSTSMNPTKSYGTTGNKTVTLTTVGPYGTSTSSQVINTSITTATAIRYVKLVSEIEDNATLAGDWIPSKLYYIEVKDTGGTNLALNKTYTKDVYSGTATDSTTSSTLITNESTANWVTNAALQMTSSASVHKVAYTIDLGATSSTVEQINMYVDNSTAKAKTYVSTNGTDWYYLGVNNMPTSMGGGVYKIEVNPVTTMPAILTSSTMTIAAPPTPLSFRYLRFTPVSSTSASADDLTYLYQIEVRRGNTYIINTGGPPYKSMSYSLTSTGTYPTSYMHSGVAYYPPGSIGNRLYDLDKSTYVRWGAETTGLKFVYDMGTTYTDVYKIAMEISGAVSTEGMTIEHSLDGTTYTSLGTFYFTSLRNVYDAAHPTYYNNASDYWEIRQDPYGPIPATGANLVQGQ